MSNVFIYELHDEIGVFYIGITSNPKQRLYKHAYESRDRCAHLSPRKTKVRQLILEKRLTMVLVSAHSSREAGAQAECAHIEATRAAVGPRLLNVAQGGEGGDFRHLHTEDAIKKRVGTLRTQEARAANSDRCLWWGEGRNIETLRQMVTDYIGSPFHVPANSICIRHGFPSNLISYLIREQDAPYQAALLRELDGKALLEAVRKRAKAWHSRVLMAIRRYLDAPGILTMKMVSREYGLRAGQVSDAIRRSSWVKREQRESVGTAVRLEKTQRGRSLGLQRRASSHGDVMQALLHYRDCPRATQADAARIGGMSQSKFSRILSGGMQYAKEVPVELIADCRKIVGARRHVAGEALRAA